MKITRIDVLWIKHFSLTLISHLIIPYPMLVAFFLQFQWWRHRTLKMRKIWSLISSVESTVSCAFSWKNSKISLIAFFTVTIFNCKKSERQRETRGFRVIKIWKCQKCAPRTCSSVYTCKWVKNITADNTHVLWRALGGGPMAPLVLFCARISEKSQSGATSVFCIFLLSNHRSFQSAIKGITTTGS